MKIKSIEVKQLSMDVEFFGAKYTRYFLEFRGVFGVFKCSASTRFHGEFDGLYVCLSESPLIKKFFGTVEEFTEQFQKIHEDLINEWLETD